MMPAPNIGTDINLELAGLGLAGIGTAWLVFVEAGHLAIAAIVVGAVAILMAFFGCCGAIVESKTMLVIYSVLLIILMNLKTALATVLYMATETLVAAINDTLKTLFANSAPSFHEIEKSLVLVIFGLCLADHVGNKYKGHAMLWIIRRSIVRRQRLRDPRLPAVCCSVEEDMLLCGARDAFEGCADIISTRLQVLADVADVTLFYAIGVEAFGLIASLYLLRTSDRPQLGGSYSVLVTNNLDSRAHVEMEQMQLVTSQPGQTVCAPCEIPV
ncbi:hypothetical protein MSG28_004837 [Choristoneura fumiferana]|uniref:Uncharacterized protein n=1 Tax=Choristoneura fumiferana TaxID=7141 RepID=A0ACC0K865_CHOFU|nr:hypothetical protein MSG28_004837 [Choristoneura fumiferana]